MTKEWPQGNDIPKSFTERFFHTQRGPVSVPLPDELKLLKLFPEAANHLWKLTAELAGVAEKRIPDMELWAFLDHAGRCLKLAQQHAEKRLAVLENKADEEELRAWAIRSQRDLARWFADNE